jgi:hypothetical protein
MNAEAFIRDLVRDENNVLYCYDDATGAPVVPGYKLKGHPSIGIGAGSRCERHLGLGINLPV